MEDYREFLERRLREELERAGAEESEAMRRHHWRWAGLYRQRLKSLNRNGISLAV